jgi:hypothetical protein
MVKRKQIFKEFFVKRLIVFIALGLLVTAAVFGEFSIAGNGRAVVDVFGIRFSDPVETTMGSETSGNDDGPEINLTVKASTPAENMGLVVKVAANSNGLELPDNAKVWVKPFDWFTVTLGRFEEDFLRYKIGASSSGFANYEVYVRGNTYSTNPEFGDMRDENAFFARFKSSGFGTHIALTPLENLYIGAAFGSVTGSRSFKALTQDGALYILKNAQFGVGYTIPNVGFARVQYIGERPYYPESGNRLMENNLKEVMRFLDRESALENASAVQAAFQLTLIEDVNIDIATSIPFLYTYKIPGNSVDGIVRDSITYNAQRPYIMGIGFDVKVLSPLRFYGRVDMETGGYLTTITPGAETTQATEGTNLFAALSVSCDLNSIFTLGVDAILDNRSGDNRRAITVEQSVSSTSIARGGDMDSSLTADRRALNNYTDLGFGLWLKANIAGGDIRTAATLKIPGVAGTAHEGAKPQLFIPVMFNYTF